MNFEKIRKISLKLYNDHIKKFDPQLLSYFPFVGWFIPMTTRGREPFYLYHAKQAFILAVFFTGVCSTLFFTLYFVSVHADILKFIIVILIYLLYVVYAVLAVIGTLMLKRGEQKEFPGIGKYITMYASKLEI